MITYNHEIYIAQAIEGVLMQQGSFQLELIIGDDCSTDNTRAICIEYQKKYPDIIKLRLPEKNLGMMPNFIQTLEACDGKYIAFCDGDDYWADPHKIQKQVDFLEKNLNFSICFHEILIDKSGSLLEDYITKIPKDITNQADLLKGNFIHTPSVVIKNTLKILPDWFMTAIPGDYPLWLMITNDGSKIKKLNDKMAVYRVHDTGVWSLQSKAKHFQKMAVTMLNCVNYLKLDNKSFVVSYSQLLSNSIAKDGFKDITFSKYFYYVFQNTLRYHYTMKQIGRFTLNGFKALLV